MDLNKIDIRNAFKVLRMSYVNVGLLSCVINVLMLTGPLYMLQVYDRVLASSSVPTLLVISTLMVLLYFFSGLLDILRGKILARIGQRLDMSLSAASYGLSSEVPLIYGPRSSTIRPVQDMDTLRHFLTSPGPIAIFDMPWMPIYLTIVFLFHPILGLTSLSGGILICLLIGIKETISRKPASEIARANNERINLTEISRRNAEVIKAMGMSSSLKKRWDEKNQTFLQSQLIASDRSRLISSIVKTFRFFLQSAVLGVGAWLAIQQEISAGIMIAASIMTSRALAPIEQAVGSWPSFVAARQSKNRLINLFNAQPVVAQRTQIPVPHRSISVESLTCGSAGSKKPIITDINFALDAGDGLGIIGPSGSGKSTLARALVGVAPVLNGCIRFDRFELSQWDEMKLGEIVGYLPQDIQLFDGTISENISRFEDTQNASAIIEAAELANIDQIIGSLPDGYNTRIGSSGFNLSAGQMQRIALARAVYKNPFLIVLDEPNSNLDAEGEIALSNTIRTMRKRGSIVIVIAHRPSAISSVEKVLVIKDGKQSTFGPKDDIIRDGISPVQNAANAS